MKNKTRSDVVIKMKHIDHAVKLTKVLEILREYAGYGGDLEIFAGERSCGTVGHDVDILSVDHVIHKE